MLRKFYNYDTHQVEDATWMGNKKERPERQCVASGETVSTHMGRVSYQCAIPSKTEVDGKKYCWRHKQMLDLGKNVKLFPPGPVNETE